MLRLLHFTNDLVNGGWGEWTAWSSCTATCGGGSRSKNRPCNTPTPAHGGKVCSGSAHEELEECNSDECSGNILLFKRASEMCTPKYLL